MKTLQFFIHYFFFLSIILGILKYFLSKKNEPNLLKEKEECPKFAILIPARDESKVIEDLLKSIQNQTRKIPMKDVYVIIENKNDPTYKICKDYKATIIIRKHLKRQSKGYALDEGIKFLKEKNKFYDAYFIFDADNILDSNYLKEMEKDYQKGYHISTGYRKIKNPNSIVSVASGLIYTIINEWINKKNLKHQKNLLLSGTGFYIHGSLIKKWKSYPFHSLTEDVELSYYACLNGLSMNYNNEAIFYDEQPISLKVSIIQRKRWVKGYFEIWLNNIHNLFEKLNTKSKNPGSLIGMIIGITPLICLLSSILLGIIYLLIKQEWLILLLILLELYIILVTFTYLIILKDGQKLEIKEKIQNLVIWYHPIFLMTYFYVFFLSIIQKNITWEKIDHGES